MRGSKIFMTAAGLLLASAPAAAEPLTEVALYHRCHIRLTGFFPDYLTDPGLARVRDGRSTAIDECMALFDSATLQGAGDRELPTDTDVGGDVLVHFHALHASWFLNKEFASFDDVSLGTESLYDPSEPAAYITRALFNPRVPVSSIWTTQENLRVVRDSIGESLHGIPAAGFVFDSAPVLPVGRVMGVQTPGPLPRTYRAVPIEEEEEEQGFREGTLEIGAHFGGGLMGSSSYLLLTVNETPEFSANGGRKMPRKWAKAVLHDVLCRDLPAVRIEDATPFVVADSQVPFRRQARCSQCHASIDRMASTIRGFRYLVLFGEGEEDFIHGGFFPEFEAPTAPAESGWPAVEDPQYGARPPRGKLYFRDHAGQLVDLPIEGPAQLGARLAGLDDPYICLAQRYYRYFTGIDAYIGDPYNFPETASSADVYHRDRVIALGKALRTSGDLRSLIEAILRSPDYRDSDFGGSR